MISASNEQLQQELEYTLLKPDCHSGRISKMQFGHEDTLEERHAIEFWFKLGKNATERYGMLQTTSVFDWHKRFKEGRESVIDDEMCGRNNEVNTPVLSLGLGLGLLCWGFKGVQEEIPPEEATSSISTRTIHQSTTPSMSQTIWPRWASIQFLSLPIVQTLLPVTFGYSPSSEAIVMRQERKWKRLWQRSLKGTSIGPSRSYWNCTSALQPEEMTSKRTRVPCVYYQ